jgi:hypothetical protein
MLPCAQPAQDASATNPGAAHASLSSDPGQPVGGIEQPPTTSKRADYYQVGVPASVAPAGFGEQPGRRAVGQCARSAPWPAGRHDADPLPLHHPPDLIRYTSFHARRVAAPCPNQYDHREARNRDGASPPTTRRRVSDQSHNLRWRGGLCPPLRSVPGCASNGDPAFVRRGGCRHAIANQPPHADTDAGQHTNSGVHGNNAGDSATDRDQYAGHTNSRSDRDDCAGCRHAANRDSRGAYGRGRRPGSAGADARATARAPATSRAVHAHADAGTTATATADPNACPTTAARHEWTTAGLGRPSGPARDSQRGD